MLKIVCGILSLLGAMFITSCGTGNGSSSDPRLKPMNSEVSLPHTTKDDLLPGPWKFTTPAEAGIDAEMLDAVKVRLENLPVYSMIIVKDGSIVDEYYKEGFDAKTRFPINSVTKSITSALVGIALEEKLINSLDDEAADYFPEWREDEDVRNDKMTIAHLLEMQTGMDWPEWTKWNFGVEKMIYSKDWISFILERPMVEQPGQNFNYNTGASQLLSAIIQKQSGDNLQSYASKRLFEPLGIRDVLWLTGPDNMSAGGLGMEMVPRDMAKFGQLYLNGGEWEGQQIVSKQWINISTQPHSQGSPYFGAYGYHWWVRSMAGDQAYFAMGDGGQYIFIVPEKKLVVVITSNFGDTTDVLPYAEHIVRAVE